MNLMESTHLRAALNEIRSERAKIGAEMAALREKDEALEQAESVLDGLVRDAGVQRRETPHPGFKSQVPSGIGSSVLTALVDVGPVGHDPDAPKDTAVPKKYPRTVDAVLTVLKGQPGGSFTVERLTKRLRAADLIDPRLKRPQGTVNEAAKRLSARDPHVHLRKHHGKSYFTYVPVESEGAPDDQEVSTG